MATRIGLFVVVICLATRLSSDSRPRWVVWNVGQGQWVTRVDADTCDHFDTGGEFAPWPQIASTCRTVLNRLHFSHWDLDHVSFARTLRRFLVEVCLAVEPGGRPSPRKRHLLEGLESCAHSGYAMWSPSKAGRTANADSRVIAWEGWLIPGDSSRTEEKVWVSQLPELDRVRVLVLGHHGSRTSTSELLLNHLPNLHFVIASQREARYGHPHAQVREALWRRRLPLLRTEDWGTIVVW